MRASRLLAILIVLQLRGRVTAETLAAEFEVSPRTIYRDIDALSAAGVPVYADRGPGGGFALLDGYRTRLTGLAADEAEAVLMLGLPGPAAALGLGGPSAGARRKLLAALPDGWREDAERTARRIHLDPAEWYRALEPARFLPALARAVLDDRAVTMRYESWRGTRDWRVDPLGLVLKAGAWYLVARTEAGGLLTFRVAAILALETLAERFERPGDFDLSAHWAGSLAAFEQRLRPETAELRASPEGLRRIAELGAHAATAVAAAEPAGEWSKLALPVEALDRAALVLLGLGPEIEVVAPLALRRRVGELAREVAGLNEASGGLAKDPRSS